jgi:hypothetical protein
MDNENIRALIKGRKINELIEKDFLINQIIKRKVFII